MRSAHWLTPFLAVAILTFSSGAWAEHHEKGESEAPAPATDGRKPWDQERMEELSGQLAKALADVRQAFRREPNFRNPTNPNRRAAQNMEQILRGLETSGRQLHNRVKGGGGFEQTQGIARKIGTQLNDAEVEGRSFMTTQWMDDRVRPAMKLINDIAPYYGSGPLFDPETMQRVDR